MVKDLSLLPLFYLGPEIVLSQKFVQEQKLEIKKFLETNGMKTSAYTAKTLLACYILLLPVISFVIYFFSTFFQVALVKVFEAYYLNSFHQNQSQQKVIFYSKFTITLL